MRKSKHRYKARKTSCLLSKDCRNCRSTSTRTFSGLLRTRRRKIAAQPLKNKSVQLPTTLCNYREIQFAEPAKTVRPCLKFERRFRQRHAGRMRPSASSCPVKVRKLLPALIWTSAIAGSRADTGSAAGIARAESFVEVPSHYLWHVLAAALLFLLLKLGLASLKKIILVVRGHADGLRPRYAQRAWRIVARASLSCVYFAAVLRLANHMPVAVAVLCSYAVVWTISRTLPIVHDAHCRTATAGFAGVCTVCIVSPMAAVFVSVALILAPPELLWWAPKRGDATKEVCKDMLAFVAAQTPPCMPTHRGPAAKLRKRWDDYVKRLKGDLVASGWRSLDGDEKQLVAECKQQLEVLITAGVAMVSSLPDQTALAPAVTLDLPLMHITWPFAQLMLAGIKSVETRDYPLGHRNIAHERSEMWLVETPGTAKGGIF